MVHVGVLEFLLPVTPGQAGTPPAKSSIEFGFLRIRLVLLRISTQIVKEQSVRSEAFRHAMWSLREYGPEPENHPATGGMTMA